MFISYIDQLDSTAERNRSLMEQYFFKCDCVWCRDKALVWKIYIQLILKKTQQIYFFLQLIVIVIIIIIVFIILVFIIMTIHI